MGGRTSNGPLSGGSSALQTSPLPAPKVVHHPPSCKNHLLKQRDFRRKCLPDRLHQTFMAPKKDRLSKEEALNFLLTHIVIERGLTLQIDQSALFNLTHLAQRAAHEVSEKEGVIPHEVIEELAAEYLEDTR